MKGIRIPILGSILVCLFLFGACRIPETDSGASKQESLAIHYSELLQHSHMESSVSLEKLRMNRTCPEPLSFAYNTFSRRDIFDRSWLNEDRQHYLQLLQLPATKARSQKLIQESLQLMNHQQRVIQEAKRKSETFHLFSPEETDQINSLFIAIHARQLFLRDWIMGHEVKPWHAYYPESYQYRFFSLGDMNLQGGVEEVEISLTDVFHVYNENAVLDALYSLPMVPDLMNGKKIFFVNGYSQEYAAVHANGQIFIFNLYDQLDDVNKMLAHEVGHELGYYIFGRDNFENMRMDVKEEYAGLYGYAVPDDHQVPWGLRLSENFAEDYAWIFGGFDKWSYWSGADPETIHGFIARQMDRFSMDDAVLLRDNFVVKADDVSYSYIGGFHEDHWRLIRSPHVTIQVDGFRKGMYGLYAHVRNDVTGNLPRVPFTDAGNVVLELGQLPEEQQALEERGYVTYMVQIKMYHYTSLRKYHQPTIARFYLVQWKD